MADIKTAGYLTACIGNQCFQAQVMEELGKTWEEWLSFSFTSRDDHFNESGKQFITITYKYKLLNSNFWDKLENMVHI